MRETRSQKKTSRKPSSCCSRCIVSVPVPGVLWLPGPGARARHRALRAGKPGKAGKAGKPGKAGPCCLRSPRAGAGPARNNHRRISKPAASPEQGVGGNAPLLQLGTLVAVGTARLSLGPQEHPPERSPPSGCSRNPGSRAGCKIPISERQSCSHPREGSPVKKSKRPEKQALVHDVRVKKQGKTDVRRGKECWIDGKKPLVVTGKLQSQ